MADIGADPALVASRSSPQAVSTKGFDRGEGDLEAWRPALIAFFERDEMPTHAANLKRGDPFDYLDYRAIEALEAAFAAMREAA